MFTPPKPNSKIIIVGGGCFGLSTAYALALKKKYEVVVYDRQPIPAPDAASSGKKKGFFCHSLYFKRRRQKKKKLA
jgi:sarcosine oxidase/L-pipecolate oxidase